MRSHSSKRRNRSYDLCGDFRIARQVERAVYFVLLLVQSGKAGGGLGRVRARLLGINEEDLFDAGSLLSSY